MIKNKGLSFFIYNSYLRSMTRIASHVTFSMVKKLVDSILVENLTQIQIYVLRLNQRYSKTFDNALHVYKIITQIYTSHEFTRVLSS